MLFLEAKNNLAAPQQGLAYRIEQTVVQSDILASRIYWETAPVKISANEAMAADANQDHRATRSDAEELLQALLAGGPMPVKTLQAEASAAGISWATVRRAQQKLNVRAEKLGLSGGWVWTMPPAEGAQPATEAAQL